MPELLPFDVIVRTDPHRCKLSVYTRFAPSLEAARENAEKVLVREQGMVLVSVLPARTDPRTR